MTNLTTPKGRSIAVLNGSPEALHASATTLQNMGETILQVGRTLQRIHDGEGSRSQKVDLLKENSGECAEKLGNIRDIYTNTGNALADYQEQLSDSVTKSKTIHQDAVELLPKIATAEQELETAQTTQHTLENAEPDPAADQEKVVKDKENASSAVTDKSGILKTLRDQLDDLKRQFDVAKDSLDTAAGDAKKRIRSAIDKSPAKDDFWDNISSILKVLKTILEIAAIVVAIAAIFCTGGLLLWVGAAIAALTVVMDIGLMKSGRASWGDIAMDMIGVLPFGKIAKGAKAGYMSTQGGRGLKLLGGAKGGASKAAKGLHEGLNPFAAKKAGIRAETEAVMKQNEAKLARLNNKNGNPYQGNLKDRSKEVVDQAGEAWGQKSARERIIATLRTEDGDVGQAKRISELENLRPRNNQQREAIAGAMEESSKGNLMWNSMDKGGKLLDTVPKLHDLHDDLPDAYREAKELPSTLGFK